MLARMLYDDEDGTRNVGTARYCKIMESEGKSVSTIDVRSCKEACFDD